MIAPVDWPSPAPSAQSAPITRARRAGDGTKALRFPPFAAGGVSPSGATAFRFSPITIVTPARATAIPSIAIQPSLSPRKR